MKLNSRAYWLVVLVGFIANLFIFFYMSKHLEEYVYFKTLDKLNVITSGDIGFNELQ